jgi:hypothetical protein
MTRVHPGHQLSSARTRAVSSKRAGYQAGGRSNGTSGGSAISPEGWLFNICLDRQRCKIDPVNGLAQVGVGLSAGPCKQCQGKYSVKF